MRFGRAHTALLGRDEIVQLFRGVIAETPRFPELGGKNLPRPLRPCDVKLVGGDSGRLPFCCRPECVAGNAESLRQQ